MSTSAFILKDMPKVELHAHLNGSVSKKTILNIVTRKSLHGGEQNWKSLPDSFLEGCIDTKCLTYQKIFANQFALLRQLCSDNETIFEITRDVIQEFADDNVKYLELRTTLKDNSSNGMTKRTYLDSVIRGIETAAKNCNITTTLILSIDRSLSLQDAEETLRLAEEYSNREQIPVIGLDLCGDPSKGKLMDFVPIFEAARHGGLKSTLHLLELPDQDKETAELFRRFIPDRIGHGTFVNLCSTALQTFIYDTVVHYKIPIEICLTSNVMTQVTPSCKQSHFRYWSQLGHPICLCTDDKGVFNTGLTCEYELAMDAFNLTPLDLWEYSYKALNYAFANNSIISPLQQEWLAFRDRSFSNGQPIS